MRALTMALAEIEGGLRLGEIELRLGVILGYGGASSRCR